MYDMNPVEFYQRKKRRPISCNKHRLVTTFGRRYHCLFILAFHMIFFQKNFYVDITILHLSLSVYFLFLEFSLFRIHCEDWLICHITSEF